MSKSPESPDPQDTPLLSDQLQASDPASYELTLPSGNSIVIGGSNRELIGGTAVAAVEADTSQTQQ